MSDTERLYRTSEDIRRSAGRAYQTMRVTLTTREIRRETDAEIRQALAQSYIAIRHEHEVSR